MAYTYDHPHPAVTTDCVVFRYHQLQLKVLLIRRKNPPFADHWALPGGFVEIDEDLEPAARRELREETGLQEVYLEQLCTFGKPDRDPRERVISVAYLTIVAPENTPDTEQDCPIQAGSDAADARWFPLNDLPRLGFDHALILQTALTRLRGKVRYNPIAFRLLPDKFTLSHLQTLYEIILQETLDKRNFRKKILALNVLQPLDEVEQGVPHRAARLYRFDPQRCGPGGEVPGFTI